MIRKILCAKCGTNAKKPLPAEDVVNGWVQRWVDMPVKRPAVHAINVNGKTYNLVNLLCDNCGVPIADGTTAVAWTMWRGHEAEPPRWEEEYAA